MPFGPPRKHENLFVLQRGAYLTAHVSDDSQHGFGIINIALVTRTIFRARLL